MRNGRGRKQKGAEVKTAAELNKGQSKKERVRKVRKQAGRRDKENGSGVPEDTVEVLKPFKLSKEEKQELARYEKTIARGWQVFLEVGNALAAIRDKRLYRSEFKTFDQYCLEQWQYRRSYAYRLVGAAEAGSNLRDHAKVPPTNEAQIRPLVGLPPEQCVSIWQQAEEVAETQGKPIQGSLVRKLVREHKGGNGKVNKQRRGGREGSIKPSQWSGILEMINRAKTLTEEHNIRAALDVIREIEVEVARLARKEQTTE